MSVLRRRSPPRGVALVTTLLAIVLVMALLAVMVDVGTARLRKADEETRALQALAAADAGEAWVRALLAKDYGELTLVLADLSSAHSIRTISIDVDMSADVQVSLQIPGATKHADHVDVNVQANPQIAESPLQVVSTATLRRGGQIVATRTVTTLLRSFHHVAPYSEIVGVIDDAGPTSVYSPGDAGGQAGGAYLTDLRIQASTESGSGPPVPADHFESDSWSDGNAGSTGLLP
jgi:hypothetical protein